MNLVPIFIEQGKRVINLASKEEPRDYSWRTEPSPYETPRGSKYFQKKRSCCEVIRELKRRLSRASNVNLKWTVPFAGFFFCY